MLPKDDSSLLSILTLVLYSTVAAANEAAVTIVIHSDTCEEVTTGGSLSAESTSTISQLDFLAFMKELWRRL